MKKTILLIVAGMVAMGANAQHSSVKVSQVQNTAAGKFDPGARVPGTEQLIVTPELTTAAAKATQAVIGTVETFGTGTNATLPTGWTESSPAGATHWKWTNQLVNFVDTLNSPSSADGWMVYDANSNAAGAANAYLQSPAKNLTGHANVGIVFNQWFSRFNDSCVIDVATNPTFTGATSYQVYLNNTLSSNDETRNTDTVLINISAVAGNQATVYVRFHYYAPGQAYGWGIDDVRFVDLDAVNMVLHRSAMYYMYDTASGFARPIGALPASLANGLDINPLTQLVNHGSNAVSNQAVNATITGPGPAYNQNLNASLAINGYDTVVDYGANTYNYGAPSGTLYTTVFTAGTAHDTVRTECDSSFMGFDPRGITNGAFWLHRPSSQTGGERSWNYASNFTVPQGHSDTITSANVVFFSRTDPGARVSMQIWQFDPNVLAWNIVGLFFTKTLDATDISPAGTPTWSSNFYPNTVPPIGNGPIILDGGTEGSTYAVIISPDQAAPATEMSFYTSAPAGFTGFWGSQAAQDSSFNNANTPNFGANVENNNGLPWSNQDVPMIRLNFGAYYIDPTAGVQNVAGAIDVANVFPNPANNTVAVNFSVNEKTNNATVTIQNTLGQTIDTYNAGQLNARQLANATFSTSGLANGIYFYTVSANGKTRSGRFAVAH